MDNSEISGPLQKKAQRWAILSATYGALAALIISDSSVIILYAAALEAGTFLSLFTTALQNISYFLLVIPIAYIIERYGIKKVLIPGLVTASVSFTLIAALPWFGRHAKYLLIVCIGIYAITATVYNAGLYPLLMDIVPGNVRGRFFARMRITYQVLCLICLVIISRLVGKEAPVHILQIIIAVVGLMTVVRIYYTAKLPELPRPKPLPIREYLGQILRNQSLMGFSVYLFCLYFFAGAGAQITFMFAKENLGMPDSTIVLLSFYYMAGAIAGFFAGGWFVDRFGNKKLFFIAHLSFGLLCFSMLAIHTASTADTLFIFTLLTVYGLITAAASIAVSSETFVIAGYSPNPTFALAIGVGLHQAGIGGARIFSGWILDSGLLAPVWTLNGTEYTRYHSVFLLYGLGVLVTAVLLSLVTVSATKARAGM